MVRTIFHWAPKTCDNDATLEMAYQELIIVSTDVRR
jgi:hypothetical protein